MQTAETRERASDRPHLYVVNGENLDKRPLQRKVLSRYTKLFIGALGVYLLFSFALGGYQIWQLKKQLKELEQERQTIPRQKEELVQGVESLNDQEVIEKIARESLGMVKPGETIIIPAIPDKGIPKPQYVHPDDLTE